jgi:hypothetical protein
VRPCAPCWRRARGRWCAEEQPAPGRASPRALNTSCSRLCLKSLPFADPRKCQSSPLAGPRAGSIGAQAQEAKEHAAFWAQTGSSGRQLGEALPAADNLPVPATLQSQLISPPPPSPAAKMSVTTRLQARLKHAYEQPIAGFLGFGQTHGGQGHDLLIKIAEDYFVARDLAALSRVSRYFALVFRKNERVWRVMMQRHSLAKLPLRERRRLLKRFPTFEYLTTRWMLDRSSSLDLRAPICATDFRNLCSTVQEQHLNLKDLSLWNGGGELVSTLHYLMNVQTLVQLRLHKCHISDCRVLMAGLRTSNLFFLDLRHNAIVDCSAIGEALKCNTRLVSLRLAYNLIVDVAALAEGLGGDRAMKFLDLGHNQVENFAPLVHAANGHRSIHMLCLEGNPLAGVVEVAELRQGLSVRVS